ncbi:uncharacterized protein EI90DRAFT_3293792, partial [Cantharellus anzutake]|uniref:uncharacterized protein n=1 Tax=Cantharellus anzutake TaxID=1750568 RepID=UPI00190744CD
MATVGLHTSHTTLYTPYTHTSMESIPPPPPKQPRGRSRKMRNYYQKTGIVSPPFRVKDMKTALNDHQERVRGVKDPWVGEAITLAEREVEAAIFAALKNTVRIDIDYRDVASHNDKATNKQGTQTNMRDIEFPTPPIEKILLDNRHGAAIEDRNGVLLAIRLPGVFEFIHDKITDAGAKFSHQYGFPTSKYRTNFKEDVSKLFKSGQAHFAYWQGLGRKDLHPVVSRDSKKFLKTVREFHDKCEPLYHILNLYSERIAPNLCKQSRKIWQSVRDFRDPDGYLSRVKSHFFSHAVHFNSDTQYHTSAKVCYAPEHQEWLEHVGDKTADW